MFSTLFFSPPLSDYPILFVPMFGVGTNGLLVFPTSRTGSVNVAPEQLHVGGISAVDVMTYKFVGNTFGFRYVYVRVFLPVLLNACYME